MIEVRFPYGSPNTDKNEPVIYICEWRVRYCRRPRAGQLKKPLTVDVDE